MNFLNDLKNNSLLICPNDIKNTVLQELNKMKKLINIKFMTIEELIKKYYFDYDNKTILYLMNTYNINYDIALIYLKNIYYIDDTNYINVTLSIGVYEFTKDDLSFIEAVNFADMMLYKAKNNSKNRIMCFNS